MTSEQQVLPKEVLQHVSSEIQNKQMRESGLTFFFLFVCFGIFLKFAVRLFYEHRLLFLFFKILPYDPLQDFKSF